MIVKSTVIRPEATMCARAGVPNSIKKFPQFHLFLDSPLGADQKRAILQAPKRGKFHLDQHVSKFKCSKSSQAEASVMECHKPDWNYAAAWAEPQARTLAVAVIPQQSPLFGFLFHFRFSPKVH